MSSERSAMLSVAAVIVAESALYTVVPPLVPGFVRDLHMTTTEVGVIVGAYSAGVLIGTGPAVALIGWRGVRFGTLGGLLLLIAATLGFGWATTPVLLDVARLVQGLGGALAFAGPMAWLTTESSVQRRGSIIGGTFGAALIGMVVGPAVGAGASQIGRPLVFTAIAVVLLAIGLYLPKKSPPTGLAGSSILDFAEVFRYKAAALGFGLMAVIGIAAGTMAALLPLLVSRLHGSAATIAMIFAASYLAGCVLNLFIGQLADRIGRLAPTALCFAIGTLVLPTLPMWASIVVLALATVIATSVTSSLWTPITAMVSDAAGPRAVRQAAAMATVNATWAAGVSLGSVAAAWAGEAIGFWFPFAILGGASAGCVLVALFVRRTIGESWPSITRRDPGPVLRSHD